MKRNARHATVETDATMIRVGYRYIIHGKGERHGFAYAAKGTMNALLYTVLPKDAVDIMVGRLAWNNPPTRDETNIRTWEHADVEPFTLPADHEFFTRFRRA